MNNPQQNSFIDLIRKTDEERLCGQMKSFLETESEEMVRCMEYMCAQQDMQAVRNMCDMLNFATKGRYMDLFTFFPAKLEMARKNMTSVLSVGNLNISGDFKNYN